MPDERAAPDVPGIVSSGPGPGRAEAPLEIINCHTHTFTHDHTPKRFLPWPIPAFAAIPSFRRAFVKIVKHLDRDKHSRLERYAEILETSYNATQQEVFQIIRGFYPEHTRFVILPMDMELMNAGRVKQGIDAQHEQLAQLRDQYPETVIPFAAVDPRHGEQVVDKTIALIENQGFRGIKLYPPIGYHPNDNILQPLYEYAEANDVPVLTHCSRPASVQYRGTPTAQMQTDPVTGQPFNLGRRELLTLFTDPESYKPILMAYPKLRLCLAHFGGAGDWKAYIKRPWNPTASPATKSWLSKILEMIPKYPNLWTDIAYTAFADDEYVYLLKVLLADEQIRGRTMFGSDFYVVSSAALEERRRSLRIRAVLGEDLFRTIAQTNPREYLGPITAGFSN